MSKWACRYFSGVPRSSQYASEANPTTERPASITRGKMSRSIDAAVPGCHGAERSGVEQVGPRVDVAGDQVLWLLSELRTRPSGVRHDEPERSRVLDVMQRDRDVGRPLTVKRQHRRQVEIGEDVTVEREERLVTQSVERVDDGAAGTQRFASR